MSTNQPGDTKGTCFVVMGFGKKTDFETGRTLDLDKSYKFMIKPAVEAAGLQCVRADEIVHSGLIDVPMYEQLLKADVVVADLSTSNKNAFYELGVRQALRPFTTIIIAEDGIKTFPFDVNRVLIRQYHHLGESIGFEEVMRFRDLLTQAIKEILERNPPPQDSPVYEFLDGLTPPAMAARVQAAVQDAIETGDKLRQTLRAASDDDERRAPLESATDAVSETHSMLMQQVDEAQKKNDFITAKSLLSTVRNIMKAEAPGRPDNPYIIQRLAIMTFKSEYPSKEAALKEAQALLAGLHPDTSRDAQTLGLWGSVHKRLYFLTKDPATLDEAVQAYKRGFYLRNDYYNGINLAYLLNVRAAAATDPAEAITDFMLAHRIRNEVLAIGEQWLAANPMPDSQQINDEMMKEYRKCKYWVLVTLGEAQLGLGDEAKAQQMLAEAYAIAPEPWMEASTREQVENLKALFKDSPLKYLKTDAGEN